MANSNNFKTAWAYGRVTDYSLIPLGLWDDAEVVHKFGVNEDVGATIEDVWSPGGIITFLQKKEFMKISSSNVGDDNTGGAGARSIVIEGLDDQCFALSETITMAGSATVTSSNEYMRVGRAYVETTGTYSNTQSGSNMGTITIQTSGGDVQAEIAVANGIQMGQSQIAIFTVPQSKAAYFVGASINVDTSKNTADVFLFQRLNINDVTVPFSPKRLVAEFDGVAGEFNFNPTAPLKFPALTDVWFSAINVGGGGANPRVDVDFEMIVVDE